MIHDVTHPSHKLSAIKLSLYEFLSASFPLFLHFPHLAKTLYLYSPRRRDISWMSGNWEHSAPAACSGKEGEGEIFLWNGGKKLDSCLVVMLLSVMFQKGETYKTIPENMFKMLQPGGTSKWCKMRPLLLTFFLYDGPLYPSSPTPFNPRQGVRHVCSRVVLSRRI